MIHLYVPLQEEYRDPATLETRLSTIARRLTKQPQQQPAGPSSAQQPGMNGVLHMPAMQQQQMPQPQQQPPQYGMAPQVPQQQQQAGPMGLQPGPSGPNGPMMQPPMQYMPTPGGESWPRAAVGTEAPRCSNAPPMHRAELGSSWTWAIGMPFLYTAQLVFVLMPLWQRHCPRTPPAAAAAATEPCPRCLSEWA